MSKPNLAESKIVKRWKVHDKQAQERTISGYFQLIMDPNEIVLEEVVFGFGYMSKPFVNYFVEANADECGLAIHVKQITFNSVVFAVKNVGPGSIEFRVNYQISGEPAIA